MAGILFNKIFKIIDSIMGSGKSSWAIEFMNSHPEIRFIYAAERLDECKRIVESCKQIGFTMPSGEYVKSVQFVELLKTGRNIAISHQLLKYIKIDDELKAVMKKLGYVLIIDEAVEIFDIQYRLNKYDAELLTDMNQSTENTSAITKYISVDKETSKVQWISDKVPGAYTDIKYIADAGNLYMINYSFIAIYSTTLLDAVDQVYVLTYMFEATDLYYFMKIFNVQYEKYFILNEDSKYTLIHGQDQNEEALSELRDLITINESDKYNFKKPEFAHGNGLSYTASTSRMIEADSNIVKAYRAANAIGKSLQCKKEDMVFARYKNVTADPKITEDMHGLAIVNNGEIAPCRYKNRGIPYNCKAINCYKDTRFIAYLAEPSMNPDKYNALLSLGVRPNRNLYSLYLLVQCIWRTRIRQGQHIDVYIPSWKMRTLFKAWLNGDKITDNYEGKA